MRNIRILKYERSSRKAISPVIATIIIVAVAIVMSIAVAYWLMGLATTFTRYEKLEFISAYPIREGNTYMINITLKSTGTSPATVSKFFFNGAPDSSIGNLTIKYYTEKLSGNFSLDGDGVTVNPGEVVTFEIRIPYGASIGAGKAVSGIALEIVVQSAAGNQYVKTIVLP